VLLKELGHKASLELLERIKASPRILIVYSNEDLETEARPKPFCSKRKWGVAFALLHFPLFAINFKQSTENKRSIEF
jgi:hypothetical protein